jgi:hypothetical protein
MRWLQMRTLRRSTRGANLPRRQRSFQPSEYLFMYSTTELSIAMDMPLAVG